MKDWQRKLVQTPIVGAVALLAFRAKTAFSYYYRPIRTMAVWLFRSNETTNYTYNLQSENLDQLAALLAHVLNTEYSAVRNYIDELENDEALKQSIARATAESHQSAVADREIRFGRRLGWYAVVRCMKPKVVVETGVDKGLGACVLTAALKKNAEEGYGGRYYGTDINPEAGYLLNGEYLQYGELLYGDSIRSLTLLEQDVDLFINDSDHSADYEGAEYRAITSKLTERAIILGDNAHVTDKLLQYSLQHDRNFVFFAERPANHWYPGGGIGISFSKA